MGANADVCECEKTSVREEVGEAIWHAASVSVGERVDGETFGRRLGMIPMVG